MEAVAGSLLGAAVEAVIAKFGAVAIKTVASIWGMQDALEKLRLSLLKVEDMLADAERRELRGGESFLKAWLAKLRQVAHDVDDVLDEIELKQLKDEAEGTSHPVRQIKSFPRRLKFSSKIRELQDRIDAILALAGQYELKKLTHHVHQAAVFSGTERRETSSIPAEIIIGRDDEKADVIRFLLSSPHQELPYSVISVVGMGGMGKTTLAQVVFNDESIRNHFDETIWTCVSDVVFTEKKITLDIIKQISRSSNGIMVGSERYATDSWELLQRRLKDLLKEKRFLLVLDDVWTEEHGSWEEFRKPFRFAGDGSKILVTTRSRNVARIVSSVKQINLQGLSEEDIWSLFSRCALNDLSISTKPILEQIGRQIVKKLKDSPLAARTVGRLLYSDLSIEHWQNVQESDMWQLSQSAHDIMPCLRLSYQHLPRCLKPCFAFLSLFPKDHKIPGEDLVRMWIALDFVRPADERGGSLEILGMNYLHALLDRGMLQIAKIFCNPNTFEEEYSYRMHDLIHDMAQQISADECFTIKEDTIIENIPSTVRHLSIFTDGLALDKVKRLQNLKQMHTILFFGQYFNKINVSGSDIHEIYMKAMKLRLLHASSYPLRELPSSIGKLKHLRYLDLSHSGIGRLPTSLCALYNIRVINLKQRWVVPYVNSLQVGMNKLKNLRNLIVHEDSNLTIFDGIGRLSELQELNFRILDKKGHRIAELQNMTELRRLKIEGLENVRSKEEAMQARLSEKIHLKEMTLEWDFSYPRSNNDDEEVLEGLRPGKSIKTLEIINYNGIRPSSWMNGRDQMPSCLQSILLYHCRNWETLPPLGGLPHLKKLTIFSMYAVKEVDPEFYGQGDVKGFPSLEYLRFKDMPALESWEGSIGDGTQLFPRLRRLSIHRCPKLEKLPPWTPALPSLTHLKIYRCQELVGLDIHTVPSLETLDIFDCPKLLLASSSSESSSSSSLTRFSVYYTSPQRLKDCLLVLQHAAPSLEILDIQNCSELKTFYENNLETTLCNLRSLVELDIWDFPNLESLPTGLTELTCLHILRIANCPKILSIPENGLPPSLTDLRINGCPTLEQRCWRHVGPDWSKISRIPQIYINDEIIPTDA